jgi:methionyl aminopeptidase
MIRLKTEEEIEHCLERMHLLVSKTLSGGGPAHRSGGITTLELDKISGNIYPRQRRCARRSLGYGGFPYTLCISVNDVVVHGFASDYRLTEGDIVSLDCGTYL